MVLNHTCCKLVKGFGNGLLLAVAELLALLILAQAVDSLEVSEELGQVLGVLVSNGPLVVAGPPWLLLLLIFLVVFAFVLLGINNLLVI